MERQDQQLWAFTCRFCKEWNGCSHPPGQSCFYVGGQGWRIICIYCVLATWYFAEEVTPVAFRWGPA